MKLTLTDDFLWDWFGMPDCPKSDKEAFSYAIQPYTSIEEYHREKSLMEQHNSSSKPLDKFLMIHAARVERTDKYILGLGL